jgi:hypothetical protein
MSLTDTILSEIRDELKLLTLAVGHLSGSVDRISAPPSPITNDLHGHAPPFISDPRWEPYVDDQGIMRSRIRELGEVVTTGGTSGTI